jgi:hypothetical protein
MNSSGLPSFFFFPSLYKLYSGHIYLNIYFSFENSKHGATYLPHTQNFHCFTNKFSENTLSDITLLVNSNNANTIIFSYAISIVLCRACTSFLTYS